VASEHISLFAAARLMALDGAAIVFVAGDVVDTDLLRTRATENRIYLAGAFEDSAVLVDPAGRVIAASNPGSPKALVEDIDLRAAANKVVYPGTHIWDQRRPAIYARAFGITERFLAS
jgi:predicted amidohydrolase